MSAAKQHHTNRAAVRQPANRGFSLVELMVAMVLGMLLLGGVLSIFVATSRSYKTNEALSEVQSNARIAFEMLARDIRQAGFTGCNTQDGRVGNVLKRNAADELPWWADMSKAVKGYDEGQTDPSVATGTAEGERATGTDSLVLIGGTGAGVTVTSHNANAARFGINENAAGLKAGDIIVACDPDHASIMQVTGPAGTISTNVVHNTGTSVSPGNCSKGLGYPPNCDSVNGNGYSFSKNSVITKLSSRGWYIGNNAAGTLSLYQGEVSSGTVTANEMVRGVTDMQLRYHLKGAATLVTASAVTDWSAVDAVEVALTMASSDQKAGTDGNAITRSFTTLTAIRNR